MSWEVHAACKGAPITLFFPEIGASTRPAKKYCAVCPVRQVCLDTAMALPVNEDHGVRGGMSARARRELRQAQALTLAA